MKGDRGTGRWAECHNNTATRSSCRWLRRSSSSSCRPPRPARGVDVGHGLGADHRGAGPLMEMKSPVNRVMESWPWRKMDNDVPKSNVIRALLAPEIFAINMPPRTVSSPAWGLHLNAGVVLRQLAADKSERAFGEARYPRASAARGVVDEFVYDHARAWTNGEG